MTKLVKIGKVSIGDGNPIAIQSMTNLPLMDVDGTLAQIEALQNAGCDIVRVALPNARSLEALRVIKNSTKLPLVADIHFDYRLVIAAMDLGIDKIRINPGNIGERNLDSVIDAAKSNNVPIRIGVNSGSVNVQTLSQCGGNKPQAMAQSLTEYVQYFESKNFNNLVLSVKSSNVLETVSCNKIIAKLGYPLHLGVTEAGLVHQGLIKNSIGIGSLLLDSIGDTIRVSLTGDPVEEVRAGIDILKAVGKRGGVQFVSCPKCGRCSIDLESIAQQIYSKIACLNIDAKIAVMGCEVNGPGECADADLGLAGSNGKCVFFKYGKIYKTVEMADAVEQFVEEIGNLHK